MMPSIRRRTAGRKVQFSLMPPAPAGLLCHRVACPLSSSSYRYLKRMANSDANLRRPSLRSMPETDNTQHVAEPKSVCLGRSDGSADTGVVIRSTVKARLSSAPDRYGSSGTGAGSSGRYAFTATTLAHSKSGAFIDLSASAASSFSFVPLVLLCCCIAAVAAAARLDAGQRAFPVSVPVVWSSVSHVPSVLRHYVSSSASAAGRGATMPHAPPAPARPIYLQRDASLAAEPPHNHNSQYGLSDVSCGQPDKGSKGEVAPPPPVFSSDADNSSDKSCPMFFVAGLLLSVTGTLISALGDICIRYSFICHKASSAVSGGTSTAEAVCSEEDPGVAPTGVGRPVFVEAACECGASSGNDCDIISSCQASFEHLNPATAVATSSPVWPNGTGRTSAFQQQYFPRQSQHVVGQMQSLTAQRVQQRISSSPTSKVAICIPALSQDRSTFSSPPFNSKQIVVAEILPVDAAEAKRKAAADTAAAALSLNTSLSLVSTCSSFLDCVSAAGHGTSVNVGISDCGSSSAVAASGRDSGKGTETVVPSDARTTPAKVCQEARRYQALNEQDITAAAPHIMPEAPAAEHGTTATRASAPMLRPAAAPGGIRSSPCGQCRWNGYWVLGISCTCIVSPVLSIISLSLLPANVTGFAALQIFFVVLLARYFLGEVVHRINLGGGVLVIAGLVTLTWSTESKPTMPDRADLYSQLVSPSAVVFEVCCGCIVLSGLLLLFFTSYFEQETEREDTTLEATAGAAVDEEVVLGTAPASEKEVKYAVLLPQQQSRQEQHRNVASGGMRPRDNLFARDELYACLSSENRLPSKPLMTSSLKESGAPSRPTGEIKRCFMLKSPVNEKGRGRTSVRTAAISGTARMAENNPIPSLQGNAVWVDNFKTVEDVSERSSALLPPGRHWTNWYLYHMFQSRSILLPVAAGVSGSIASEATIGVCSLEGLEEVRNFSRNVLTTSTKSYRRWKSANLIAMFSMGFCQVQVGLVCVDLEKNIRLNGAPPG